MALAFLRNRINFVLVQKVTARILDSATTFAMTLSTIITITIHKLRQSYIRLARMLQANKRMFWLWKNCLTWMSSSTQSVRSGADHLRVRFGVCASFKQLPCISLKMLLAVVDASILPRMLTFGITSQMNCLCTAECLPVMGCLHRLWCEKQNTDAFPLYLRLVQSLWSKCLTRQCYFSGSSSDPVSSSSASSTLAKMATQPTKSIRTQGQPDGTDEWAQVTCLFL